MMKIEMPKQVSKIIRTLEEHGFEAFAVGGCVRDSVLGRRPNDWDITTSAMPWQTKKLFKKTVDTGIQHGTVTVLQDGIGYEVTTYRIDGEYEDGRHPKEVVFTENLREDLRRRDFTINAMAYNEKEGLIDPFGGQNDLQQGIVRAVGVPHQRFTEDALRILRLYRFAARYGFAIDPATGQAAEALCTHLDCVSAERIEEELSKLLAAPAPAAYLDEKILTVILPELAPEALDAAKPAVDACPAGSENLPIRLAALLLSLGEDGTRKVLRRLRCSNALIEETAVLVRESGGSSGSFLLGHESGHSIARPTACGGRVPSQRTVLRETSAAPDTAAIRKLLGRYGLTAVQRLAALGTALHPERAADFAAQARSAEQMEADGVCCRISQLAVNGRDLMAAGIPAGPGLRRVLEALLDGVIRGEYPNEKQALLEQAHKISAS